MDKLAKVWRKDGSEAWILLHVEVQNQHEDDFNKRMFTYHYRLLDKYDHPVVNLAVPGDTSETWRPNQYQRELWGCKLEFEFPMVKLVDYRQQWAELEASTNPFATVVMAHLKTQDTRYDGEVRKHWKLIITRHLFEAGYDREEIIQIYRFIDWLM